MGPRAVLPGPYKVPNYRSEFLVVYTNTPCVSPYRGAGRPHACFVMERLIDRVARELGLEPNEVRRRNFLQPEDFPWDVGLTFQDGAPTKYDAHAASSSSRVIIGSIPRYRQSAVT